MTPVSSTGDIAFSVELTRANRARPIVKDFSATDEVVGGVPCEWVESTGPRSDLVIIYYHGGAYISGDAENSRAATVSLAQQTGARVLVPNYRLGPEHPFPAAYDDAFSVYAEVVSESGRDASDIILCGDSVGGSLPASLLAQAVAEGMPMPRCVVSNSPVTDMCGDSASLDDPRYAHPRLTKEYITWLQETYLATSDADRADVRWSPVYADLTGLPPMLVQLGGRDPLHDDGFRLARRAQTCGVRVAVTEYPESGHSWILRGTNPRDVHAEAALSEAADFIVTGHAQLPA